MDSLKNLPPSSSLPFPAALGKPLLVTEIFWLFAGLIFFLARGFLFQLQDTASWQEVRVMAWWITAIIGVSYLLQAATKRFTLFSARNGVLFGVVYWILSDVLQNLPQLSTLSVDVASRGILYVFLFVLALQAGYLMPAFSWVQEKVIKFRDPKGPYLSFFVILAVFAIGVFPYLYYSDWSIVRVWQGILSSRYSGVEVGWRRGILGDERALILSLDYFFVAFPSLVAFYIISFRRHRVKKFVLIGLTLFVWAAEFFMGTRQVFGFVVLGPCLIFYLALPKKKRRLFLWGFAVFLFFLFYLMEIQVRSRARGFADQREAIFSVEFGETDRYVSVDDNFYQFCRLIEFVPARYEFVRFDEFWYLLTRPIPRFLWEDKPTGFGLFFARQIIGRKDTTYSYSVLGDFYVSFGAAGIFLGGILFGMLCRNLDQLIPRLGTNKFGIAMFTLCYLTLVMSVRSLQIFVFFGYYLLAFFLVARLISVSLRKY